MSDLVERYLGSLRHQGKPRNYKLPWLRLLQEFCREQGACVETFTCEQLEEYRRWLLWRRHSRGGLYSPNTLDQILRSAVGLFRWAHRRGLMETNPARGMVLPRVMVSVPAPLTRQEVAALLDAPDPFTPLGLRDRALLAVLYHTGIGARECEKLVLAQVQLHARSMRVGKENASIPEELVATLSAYLWVLQVGRQAELSQPVNVLALRRARKAHSSPP